MKLILAAVAASLALAVSVAPSTGDQVELVADAPSFQDFYDTIHRDADGVWVINGDETIYKRSDLRDLYRHLYRQPAENELIVNQFRGNDDAWDEATRQRLSYCVSQAFPTGRYNATVTAMTSATGAWESAANVDFVHVPSADSTCTTRNAAVLFTVQPVCRGRYLARAFFPSTKDQFRKVLIDCTSFGDIRPWSLAGVLRHELGHVLGFRHEHTRPDAGTCFEDNQWRALTAYDSASVMHYPQCNGTNTGDLNLTNLDKQGAAIMYP